jgi:outer membrane protein assembly factor BamD (BamD/ComL family)
MPNSHIKFIVSLLLSATTLTAGLSAQEAEKESAEKRRRFAEKIFDGAEKKYEERNYRDGALDLLALIDSYPSFAQFDEAANLLGAALYEIQYFEAADQVYRHLLKSVLKSPLVPEAILGLQKVYYHKGEFQQALKFYKALEAHYASHATIDEARYYAMQANFQLQNYTFVINTIRHVRRGSDVYPFALYTTALTDLKKKMFARPFPASSMSAKLRPNLASCEM